MPVIRQSAQTQGFLALLGDKALFWSDDRQAFISYVATRHYWIAMGDPVGRERSFEGLLWRFREEADRYGAKIVLYQVAERHLPLYLDLGLLLLKLGQEARVPLGDFTLEGKRRENLRHGRSKLVRAGLSASRCWTPPRSPPPCRACGRSPTSGSRTRRRTRRASPSAISTKPMSRAPGSRSRPRPTAAIMAFANLWEVDGQETKCRST